MLQELTRTVNRCNKRTCSRPPKSLILDLLSTLRGQPMPVRALVAAGDGVRHQRARACASRWCGLLERGTIERNERGQYRIAPAARARADARGGVDAHRGAPAARGAAAGSACTPPGSARADRARAAPPRARAAASSASAALEPRPVAAPRQSRAAASTRCAPSCTRSGSSRPRSCSRIAQLDAGRRRARARAVGRRGALRAAIASRSPR